MQFFSLSRGLSVLIVLCITLCCTWSAQAGEVYKVQAGDTLWELSKQWGVSVEDIQTENSLNSDHLKLGQALEKPKNAKAKEKRKKQVSRGGYRDVAELARNFMGVRYAYAGRSPSGFDCSGFTSYVYALNGLRLPHVAAGQYDVGSTIGRTSLESGDLVFFKNGSGINHVGIYVGSNQFIHASTSRGVRVDNLSDSYWGPRYAGARRVL